MSVQVAVAVAWPEDQFETETFLLHLRSCCSGKLWDTPPSRRCYQSLSNLMSTTPEIKIETDGADTPNLISDSPFVIYAINNKKSRGKHATLYYTAVFLRDMRRKKKTDSRISLKVQLSGFQNHWICKDVLS